MNRLIFFFALTASMLTMGCGATSPATHSNNLEQVRPEGNDENPERAIGLLIQGYNYTDMFIDSFTVNGVGGGNIFVSNLTTGGGKSTCCYSFTPATPRPRQLRIRWAAGYCIERKANPYSFGPRFVEERRTIWKEITAPIQSVSLPAKALEVHFYPDGHVEAAVTPGYSPPRLKLPVTADEQRPGASYNFPLCSHDQLHQGQ